MKTEENDLTRFCKHCGTELFFLDRFPEKGSTGVKKNEVVVHIDRIIYGKRDYIAILFLGINYDSEEE